MDATPLPDNLRELLGLLQATQAEFDAVPSSQRNTAEFAALSQRLECIKAKMFQLEQTPVAPDAVFNRKQAMMSLLMLLALALFLSSPAAMAQQAGPSIPSAALSMFAVPALSTNTLNVAQPIFEYDYVGFTITLNAGSANTSTATLHFVQSYDGGLTYESLPSFTYVTPPLNGTTPVTFGTNFFCYGTHLKLVDVCNTNASTYFTNVTAKFSLKSPKLGADTRVGP
ncbi:MAG TPA: hypothetical protein VFE51_22890 [Verrucomicrobiae bacterium]|nr:hypothetical protein [Verrucomicrobiae bacterium]